MTAPQLPRKVRRALERQAVRDARKARTSAQRAGILVPRNIVAAMTPAEANPNTVDPKTKTKREGPREIE